MDQIKKTYLNVKQPGSFSGLNVLKRQGNIKSKIETIKKSLSTLPAYALHHTRRRLFPRRKIYVPYPNAQWGADLADIQKLSTYNNRYRYILCVIDMFSKLAWMEPIRNKTSKNVTKAFKTILKRSGHKPEKLQTDAGKEFLNKDFQKLLSQENIHHFCVTSEIKCSMIERFIRTIMNKIRRFMTSCNKKKFVHLLPEFELLYNNTYHRSIKMTPNEVCKTNQEQVYRNLYGYEPPSNKERTAIKIGDKVRVSKLKKTFEKGYDTNFTAEIFKVVGIKNTNPTMYYLEDLENEKIEGGFYKEELLKIYDSI